MHAPTVSSLGVFFCCFPPSPRETEADVVNASLFARRRATCSGDTFMKSLTRRNFSILRISSPSLIESPRAPSPISPHNALLPACPLVIAVPRYDGSPPPPVPPPLPYLTHSYANIRFQLNIWWQEFLSLSLPWLCCDRLARAPE